MVFDRHPVFCKAQNLRYKNYLPICSNQHKNMTNDFNLPSEGFYQYCNKEAQGKGEEGQAPACRQPNPRRLV